MSFSSLTSAQFVWIQHAPSFTDHLNGVAFLTPMHGFVVGTRAMLKETRDGGRTWHSRSGVSATTPTVDPFYEILFLDSQVGLITGNNDFAFRSTDGGLTWQRMSSMLTGSWYYLDAVSPHMVFVGANGSCGFSGNAGLTWERRSVYPDCPIMYGMDFRDANWGLAVGNHASLGVGIYLTTDGGRTWSQRLAGAFSDVVFMDSNVVLATNGAIYRSSDAGFSWMQITPPVGVAELERVDSSTLVGVSDLGDIWRSADGGFTWEKV